MKKVFLISLQKEVEVVTQFATCINGYYSPAYTIRLPDGSVQNVVSAQVIVDISNPIPVVSSHLAVALRELFEEIKHGDEEHQKWLKDKIEDFITKKNLI